VHGTWKPRALLKLGFSVAISLVEPCGVDKLNWWKWGWLLLLLLLLQIPFFQAFVNGPQILP
jgi:hypothetical protein